MQSRYLGKVQPIALGAWLYIASVQYFIVQFVVASRWTVTYSLAHNTISDLGNSACGLYGGRYVCSPLYQLMNVSFVLLGITMIFGSLLLARKSSHHIDKVGFCAMAFAGLGTILVGLFPENSVVHVHALGAALPFLIGNAAILLLGFSNVFPRWLRAYSITTGSITLIALVFFVAHAYGSLGAGGVERIVAYPQTVWLITVGLYLLNQKGTIQQSERGH